MHNCVELTLAVLVSNPGRVWIVCTLYNLKGPAVSLFLRESPAAIQGQRTLSPEPYARDSHFLLRVRRQDVERHCGFMVA